MTQQSEDEEREERINMEIIVDAYGPEEQARGNLIRWPFPWCNWRVARIYNMVEKLKYET